ncbi:uncharacterized protein LOC109856749 [Pseudomyrmex gracilis]|uniref:uncharacterized protein LOC109856749 n=1 Tax=Pseudomyrmex gracilis TaxID=219809 RepID=UPI0009954AA7|nr:uncharacterized protein LOC109856749 [Pseudomyrmex gracilis]
MRQQTHPNMQTLRPQVSPGRTPSPMEYSTYNPPLVQQQYQPNIIQPMMQQSTIPPAQADVQSFSYNLQPEPSQLQLESNLLMLHRVTPESQREPLQPVNNTDPAPSLLDMDNQQFNFDWNSAELLADFGANLSANLSTGLSISDSIQVDASNNEERNSMTERITWINQELSALNKIFPPRQNDE